MNTPRERSAVVIFSAAVALFAIAFAVLFYSGRQIAEAESRLLAATLAEGMAAEQIATAAAEQGAAAAQWELADIRLATADALLSSASSLYEAVLDQQATIDAHAAFLDSNATPTPTPIP